MIDFGNGGLPSLLYVISYGMNSTDRECYVYGYSERKAELFSTMLTRGRESATAYQHMGGDNFRSFEIVTDKNDVKYLRVYIAWQALEDKYYTVKNGDWCAELYRFYYIHANGDVEWYVNGNLVDNDTYDSAPETELGIVNTSETPDNPDAVYAVLAELSAYKLLREKTLSVAP